MKFVSKSSNYLVVLSPSIPAEPLRGVPAIPGLSVRFEDGIAIVEDEQVIQKMMSNIYFNRHFFIADDNKNMVDALEKKRLEAEPEHIITEMKYGTPVKSHGSTVKKKVSPELEKYIKERIEDGIKTGLDIVLKKITEEKAEKDKSESTTEVAAESNGTVKSDVAENATGDKSKTPKRGRPGKNS